MRRIAFWLALILIFMIPWEGSITVGTMGTLTRAIGFVAAGVWALSVLMAGRLRRPRFFHAAVLLFVVWNAVSVFWSVAGDVTEARMKTFLQLVILVWITWDLLDTPEALKAGMQTYVLGAYISVGSTLLNFVTGNAFLDYGVPRYTATGQNANDLALILALGLPLAWHLAVHGGRGARVLKLLNYAYIPAAMFSILLTASRMALFCTVPALVYMVGTFRQLTLRLRALIFAALVAALFLIQSYVPQASLARLATTGASITSGSLGGRSTSWNEGLELFQEHPVLGVGSGAFPIAAYDTRGVAHNTFLSVLAELGLIGFILFVAILAAAFLHALRQRRRYFRLWLAVLLVWAIGVAALTWEYKKPTWLILGLVVVSASVHGRRESPPLSWEMPVEPAGGMGLPLERA